MRILTTELMQQDSANVIYKILAEVPSGSWWRRLIGGVVWERKRYIGTISVTMYGNFIVWYDASSGAEERNKQWLRVLTNAVRAEQIKLLTAQDKPKLKPVK